MTAEHPFPPEEVEGWRPIPGSPGYEASSLGRLRSPRTVLKPWASNPAGHLKATVGRGRREWVHRLILLAFVGPCPEGMEVHQASLIRQGGRQDGRLLQVRVRGIRMEHLPPHEDRQVRGDGPKEGCLMPPIDWNDLAHWGVPGHNVHISTQAPDRHVEPDQEAS